MDFVKDHKGVCALLGLFVSYKFLKVVVSWPRVGRIPDRYVLVTGSARGFGNDIVRRLDKMGCHVLASCRSENGTAELRAATSKKCHVFVMDVSNPESVRKGVEYVKSVLPRGQGLWGIVNNAGIFGARNGMPQFYEISHYREVMDINLYGLIDVTMAFFPLVKASQGRIVNMSSLYGRFGVPFCTPYVTSKFAIEGFSDSIRRSLRVFKVSVHLIEAGIFRTDFTSPETHDVLIDETWKAVSQETRDEYGEEFHRNYKKFVMNVTSWPYGNHISHVTDQVVKALFSRYPRARYVVGNDAKYVFLPVNSLPEWFSDWVVTVCGACPDPASMNSRKQNKGN